MVDKNAKDENDESKNKASFKSKIITSLTKPYILILSIFVVVVFALMGIMALLLKLQGPAQSGTIHVSEMQPPPVVAEKGEVQDKSPPEKKESHAKEESKDQKPQFYKFKPSFVVNVPDRGQIRYLQVDVELMTRNPKMIENIETYAPLIRNDLITLFSSQNYEDLISVEGKELLRTKSLEIVQKIMKENVGENAVDQVLFTNFVTQ